MNHSPTMGLPTPGQTASPEEMRFCCYMIASVVVFLVTVAIVIRATK